ncbi:MAG: AAA family ATPase [Deltaproteobacteria bacterium]|nr:AAA family ATPase [Deltaproteobacteria bacterium]
MQIKKLEMVGFKSFVDPTIIDFDSPLIGIVGPNGCGKSNIVDAIRWVMGEMSAKSLRGRGMEDVIFNGSQTRPPINMAEVSLTFSTEDGIAPAPYTEFSEITITRRLFRDGESEYLINKIPCRLRDIINLFLGTGVGHRAYSVIEQGRIDFAINAKPEDRRLLIEEAAGVSKFKARKEAAVRKMEATRQNLARLKDILVEVQRQIGSLDRQVKKAEKYRQLKEEVKSLDLKLASLRYREANTEKGRERKSGKR